MAHHSPITLISPEDVVLACPLMLGYWPSSSVCAVFVDADQRVVVIMRWDHDADVVPPPLHPLTTGDTRVDAVHLVVFPPTRDVDVAPWLQAADGMVAAGIKPGHFVLAGQSGEGIVWTHALDPAEDPRVGVLRHEEVLSRSREWGLPLWEEDRDAYVGDVAPRAEVAARVRTVLARTESVTEEQRDSAIDDVRAALDRTDLSEEDIAMVGVALADVQVRDTVLWDVMQEAPTGWGATADRLAAIVAAMPESHVPAPATLLAIVRWQMGDGSRAAAAAARALACDPDYTLAVLVDRCLATGMHPSTWRAGLVTLSRSECRRAA